MAPRFRKGVALVIAAGALGLGCELIVDFDRTKIPVDTADGATPTGDSSVDATIDTFVPVVDAAAEAAVTDAADASADAPDGD
jgi:hypothetical protein